MISTALGIHRDRRRPTRKPGSSRGQSLVEFALLVPFLLLIVLFAVDFGRIYMGWVTINGMARVGANYAAQHPDAWTTPGDPTARAEYLTLMTRSEGAIDCALVPPPPPTFPSGRLVGKPAQATSIAISGCWPRSSPWSPAIRSVCPRPHRSRSRTAVSRAVLRRPLWERRLRR